jgi:hypothetical protein
VMRMKTIVAQRRKKKKQIEEMLLLRYIQFDMLHCDVV